MSHVFSVQSDDLSILRTLCRSDPTAWCFIPLGDRRITRCSVAFLRLWGMPGDFLERFPTGLSIHDDSLRTAFDRLGVGVDFLSRIADGSFPSYDASILLVRSDNIRMLASWAPVLDERGRPSGRLIRFSPQLPGNFTDQMVTSMAEARRRLSVLSEREQEVLNHLFEGKTNKAIAIMTHLSEKTIEKHRSRIMQKLALQSTAELVKLVARSRLLEDAFPQPEHNAC